MTLKRILLILLITLMFLSVTACWDRTEVDETAIVIGLGIDKVPGKKPFLLTVQIVNPIAKTSGGSSGGAQKPYLVLSSQGKSFFEAVRNFATITPRKLIFSHNKMIVMGKGLAQSGIAQVMDYMDRDPEFRRTSWMLVANDTAKKIIEAQVPIEALPAKGVEIMMLGFQRNAFVYPITRNKFVLNLKSDTKVSYAPIIELKKTKNSQIKIIKTAIFKSNRLIGELNAEESRSLLWLKNEIIGDTVIIPFESKGGQQQLISIDINEGKTEITPVFSAEGVRMQITCQGKATLQEAENTRIQIKSQKVFDEVNSQVEEILKSRLERTIVKAQKQYNADFVEFATTIHNYSPQEWNRVKNRWQEVFPAIKFSVAFDIKTTKIGMIRDSTLENLGDSR